MDSVKPFFSKDSIAVVLASDENYLLYLSVTLSSIIDNSDNNLNYDVIIFSNTVTSDYERRLLKMIKDHSNFQVRFFNVDKYISKYGSSIFRVKEHFTIATYYRFFIPSVMKEFDKVLYLDSDLVVNKDIGKLFKIDLEDNYLAAVPSLGPISLYYLGSFKKYFEEVLRITDPNKYFNAGVILFNIKKFSDQTLDQLIDKLKEIKKPILLDQDIFNAVCDTKVKTLDQAWNLTVHILTDEKTKSLPQDLAQNLKNAISEPYILHYTSQNKPWNSYEVYFSDIFWKYARSTPFYEEIQICNLNSTLLRSKKRRKFSSKVKRIRYTFLSKISFGNRKQKYLTKLKDLY